MQILGVLDIQGGVVVRGVAGRRHEYRPLLSCLTSSTQPRLVARALRDRLGLEQLYLADLDAIAGAAPRLEDYAELATDGFGLWIDAGVRRVEQARLLAGIPGAHVVIGLETVAGPSELARCVQQYPGQVIFSLDLRDGEPLGDRAAWHGATAKAIAAQAIAMGVRRLLLLDLAHVGVGQGLGTEVLCAHLAAAHPELFVAAGGGVRGRADLERLAAGGVQAVLVASALHDGWLRREDLAGLGGSPLEGS
jgi:phosphoribosylformimino-5-aminoimidazole carboxamide ribotide isomerase